MIWNANILIISKIKNNTKELYKLISRGELLGGWSFAAGKMVVQIIDNLSEYEQE